MEQIIKIILDKGNIDWQNLLYELVKYEQMDPWDIDIILLTKRFIQIINALKEMDFNLSGKMLLAAALLLKLKSEYLLQESVDQEQENDFNEEPIQDNTEIDFTEPPAIVPRLPKPRIRKISIYELVDSLERAMKVNQRKLKRMSEKEKQEIKVPEKKIDIEVLISKVFSRLKKLFRRKRKVKFFELIKTKSREEIVYTLLPLLYLANEEKVILEQEKPFEDIIIIYNE